MPYRRRRRAYRGGWEPYVPAAARRHQEARSLERLVARGGTHQPVRSTGHRHIAETFWGRAWCENLESYSDFANRLPRGRTYLRRGAVWDLRIAPGSVQALVIGRQPDPYRVAIRVQPARAERWRALAARCAGSIDSVVALLGGRLDGAVMERIVDRATGLFPAPGELALSCSCPDWATVCKHVAAALYGVGVRLDRSPELLFVLRGVDHLELVAGAATVPAAAGAPGGAVLGEVLEGDLGGIFGIDIDVTAARGGVAGRVAASAKKAARTAKARPARPAAGEAATARPGKPARTTVAARTRLPAGRRITPRELLALGVPRTTFQNWPGSGVLERTGKRGVFRTTNRTEEQIARALARCERLGR